MNLRKFMWWRREMPCIILWTRRCEDRCTQDFPDLLPKLERTGSCNSSHGGSCCTCGGPLPDIHDHLHADCTTCPKHGRASFAFGGNVCSDPCLNVFVQWLENAPPRGSICPGHAQDWGGGSKVFGSWGRHRQHIVKVEERRAQ